MTSIRSAWTTGLPTIDGVAQADEWDGGGPLVLPNARVYFMNDVRYLYILADVVGEERPGPDDYIWAVVDVDRNMQLTKSRDVAFQGWPDAPVPGVIKRIYQKKDTWIKALSTMSRGATTYVKPTKSTPPHRIWELAVDLDEINAGPATWGSSEQPPVVRLALQTQAKGSPVPEAPMPAHMLGYFGDAPEISLATQPEFPATAVGPVFYGVGLIPFGCIDPNTGRATNQDVNAPLVVENAAFGGRIDVFANIRQIWDEGATHYRITYRREGGPDQDLRQSWTNYRREFVNGEWKDVLHPFGPDVAGTYALPDPNEDWLMPNLLLRWPTHRFGGGNGLYSIGIEFSNAEGLVDLGDDRLQLYIDNTAPTVDIPAMQHATQGTVGPCAIVDQGPYRFQITVEDPEGHLQRYLLTARHGDPGSTPETIAEEEYDSARHGPSWNGVVQHSVPVGGADWKAGESCAYEFRLEADARITNGYGWIYQDAECSKYVTILVR